MAEMDYSLNRSNDVLDVGEAIYNRKDITSSAVTVASGSLRLAYFTAQRPNEFITQIRLYSGSTAAGATPTLVRIGVYEVNEVTGDLTLVASTANDTTLFAATNTSYTKALSASWLKEKGKRYAIGVLVVTAAAVPTFTGQNAIPAGEAAMSPRITAYTAQTDLPNTITAGSLTNGASRIYYVCLP
jgi:hypothetical protein